MRRWVSVLGTRRFSPARSWPHPWPGWRLVPPAGDRHRAGPWWIALIWLALTSDTNGAPRRRGCAPRERAAAGRADERIATRRPRGARRPAAVTPLPSRGCRFTSGLRCSAHRGDDRGNLHLFFRARSFGDVQGVRAGDRPDHCGLEASRPAHSRTTNLARACHARGESRPVARRPGATGRAPPCGQRTREIPSAGSSPLPAQVTRVAAVDLGTNTTRLLVADVVDGRWTRSCRRRQITRLGEGVDARRRLLPLPIARVRNVLADYRREARALGAERMLAVATSAIRDSENGEAFLGEIEWSYGFTTRLLSGDEEAALTRRGVGDRRRDDTLIFDIGGGSTELIIGDCAREHRRRLGADDRERFGEDARGDRRARAAALLPHGARARRARSASPARSRRSPRSTSGSRSTTASGCTDTC